MLVGAVAAREGGGAVGGLPAAGAFVRAPGVGRPITPCAGALAGARAVAGLPGVSAFGLAPGCAGFAGAVCGNGGPFLAPGSVWAPGAAGLLGAVAALVLGAAPGWVGSIPGRAPGPGWPPCGPPGCTRLARCRAAGGSDGAREIGPPGTVGLTPAAASCAGVGLGLLMTVLMIVVLWMLLNTMLFGGGTT